MFTKTNQFAEPSPCPRPLKREESISISKSEKSMDILEKIVAERRKSVDQLKQIVPRQAWEAMPLFEKKCLSLKKNLSGGYLTGIITEFKRASPSKGIINDKADITDVISDYEIHGASGISILTEEIFFKGNNDDILEVAGSLSIPVLRKDFIVDEYQLLESKAIGADVILLIAACLNPKEVKRFSFLANQLGMEVL